MRKYITQTEIDEIKAMKTGINYSDLHELKKILEKHDKKASINNNENYNNIFDIYFEKHKNTIGQNKLAKDFVANNPQVTFKNPDLVFFQNFFEQVDPEGCRILMMAKSIIHFDFEKLKSKLNEFNINNFDTEMFVLNEKYDFDFSPYTINGLDKIDKDKIKNATTLSLNVFNFFDEITKGLDEETKQGFKNNFLGTIDSILKNVERDDIIQKDLKFRNILSFLRK